MEAQGLFTSELHMVAIPAKSTGGGDYQPDLTSVHREGVETGSSPRAHSLGRELGVAGRGEPSSQVLEDVEGQTADQSDDGHFPQEGQSGDEVHVNKFM